MSCHVQSSSPPPRPPWSHCAPSRSTIEGALATDRRPAMAGMTNLLVFVWGWIGARFPRRCSVVRVGCVMAQEPVSHTLRIRCDASVAPPLGPALVTRPAAHGRCPALALLQRTGGVRTWHQAETGASHAPWSRHCYTHTRCCLVASRIAMRHMSEYQALLGMQLMLASAASAPSRRPHR